MVLRGSDKCETCKSSLEEYYWYCNNCEIFICYDCVSKHVEHDLIALKNLGLKKAEKVLITIWGMGLGSHKWVTTDKNKLLNDYKACKHALKFLDENKFIFECYECKNIICPLCLPKHEIHTVRPFVLLNDDKTLRLVHYIFYPSRNVNLSVYGPIEAYKG